MTVTTLLTRPAWRLALGVAAASLPFIIYGVAIGEMANSRATPTGVVPAEIGLDFAMKSGALFAQEMIARERFLLTSALMLTISFLALGYALGLMLRRRGAVVAGLATALSAIVGYIAVVTAGNAIRDLAVVHPLAAAAKAEATWGVATLASGLDAFVEVNTFFGLAAVMALMLRFADLAIGLDDDAPTAAGLDARAAALRQTLLTSSAILTAATVATYFFYHYPLALMTTASRDVYVHLSGVASVRWGATYTLMLIAAAAPAIAAHLEDRRATLAMSGVEAPAAPKWLSSEALTEKAKILAAVLGVLAPALAAPLLEILKIGTG